MNSARLIVAGALGLSLVCSWSPPASAQQNQRSNKKYIATRQITVDQQTGTLRLPTPDETQALVDNLITLTNRSIEGLLPRALPSGAVTVDLQDRFELVTIARPNPDGTSEVRCVASFEEAADFLGLVEDTSQR
jgi:hypothetical protein